MEHSITYMHTYIKTVIFRFFSKSIYLSITILCSSKQSSAFFPILETLLKRTFWYYQQLLFPFFFYLAIVTKQVSFRSVFSFGNSQKSAGAKSGECGGWAMITLLFLTKEITHKHRHVSWCVIIVQNPWLVFSRFCAFPMNFAPRNRRITSRQYSLLTVRPCGKNSRCTTPLQSRNSEQNLHIWTWRAFFGFVSSGRFRWDDWGLVWMS